MKKVVINKDKCLGCGMCVGIESDVFDFDDDGLAKVNNDNINDDNKENVKRINYGKRIKDCGINRCGQCIR